MDKFGRNYLLSIASTDKGNFDLFIKPPFTIEFDITRKELGSANIAQIKIYNISLENRNRIRHDSCDYGKFKSIELRAGYGNNIVTIFSGNITQASSSREGTNFITQIECFDGGFAYNNGVCNLTFVAGIPLKVVIAQIAATLPNVTIGKIGDYPGVLSKGNTYSGNSMSILTELTSGGAYIDGGKFYALGINEYVVGLSSVGVLGSSSGLLGTPILEQNIIHFDMIFEPGLNLAQSVRLDSSTAAPGFNGLYKIIGVKHRGMISDSVCGSVITTGEFYFPIKAAP